MMETMHKYDGLGLAGPQIGVLKRIIVIDLYDDKGVIVLINPVITKTKGEREVDEGCLSYPNKFAKVKRPEKVIVEGLNEKGEKVKIEAVELLAQALCHEIDHLDGKLYYDRINKLNPFNNSNNKLFYINDHYDEEITVGMIAEKFFVSESYLYRLFKKELHQTPHKYIREKRLMMAQKMLSLPSAR